MLPVGLDVGRLKDYDRLVEPALRMRIRSAAVLHPAYRRLGAPVAAEAGHSHAGSR